MGFFTIFICMNLWYFDFYYFQSSLFIYGKSIRDPEAARKSDSYEFSSQGIKYKFYEFSPSYLYPYNVMDFCKFGTQHVMRIHQFRNFRLIKPLHGFGELPSKILAVFVSLIWYDIIKSSFEILSRF